MARKRSEVGKTVAQEPKDEEQQAPKQEPAFEPAQAAEKASKPAEPPPLEVRANEEESPVDVNGLPMLTDEFEEIVETVYKIDVRAEYERLVRDLRIGDKAREYAAVNDAMDRAEDNARLAFRLYLNAKKERERFEIDCAPVEGAMRDSATQALAGEKESGKRSKQITEADVSAKMAELFPDQYRAWALKRVKVKGMADSLQNLAELWQLRCKSLQTMLGKVRT